MAATIAHEEIKCTQKSMQSLHLSMSKFALLGGGLGLELENKERSKGDQRHY